MNLLIRLDKLQKTFTYIADAPVIPIRKPEVPIDSILAFEVETQDWSDDSSVYSSKNRDSGRVQIQNGFFLVSSGSRGTERVGELLLEQS